MEVENGFEAKQGRSREEIGIDKASV